MGQRGLLSKSASSMDEVRKQIEHWRKTPMPLTRRSESFERALKPLEKEILACSPASANSGRARLLPCALKNQRHQTRSTGSDFQQDARPDRRCRQETT